MKLPTLYKKTSTGAQQEWSIWTEDNVICTRWGQTGGAMQEGRDIISEGKNLGKKNATTPAQQAELEARSLWEKKKKNRGYVETAAAAMAGETDALIEGGIFPMLAHRFDQHGEKIKYPAYAQPKLDGHRCITMVSDDNTSMWSRTRKPIKSLPHILREFSESVMGHNIFDGELYNHAYRDNFEKLTSFIRPQEPKEGHEVVEYHIYDWVLDDTTFEERYEALQEYLGSGWSKCLKLVETIKVKDEDELMAAFEHFTDQGYEGLMVRNAAGLYVQNRRSYDLQKVKEFIDKEFVVVGVHEGRGKLAGKAIFDCLTDSEDPVPGLKFGAKMKGKLGDLAKFVKKPQLAIGRKLTVKFQNYYTSGIPRFPVAARFREDI